MEYQMVRENLLILLKNMLNEHGVKLWLTPYHGKEGSNVDSLQELAVRYHHALNTDPESCLEMLQEIQSISLCRLEERQNFRTQGLATIRVRVSGKQMPEFSVQIKLCDIVNDLRESIAQKVEVPGRRLKLISKGRVLAIEGTLESQNVKHGCTVLVVVLATELEKDELVKTNNNQVLLDETKSDIECLMNGHSEKYLNITNQLGSSLNLPPEEKKALAVAMALHEKGRKAFRRGEFALALVFLLEADSEFKYCRSDILEKVDNYALVNLDIVWAYLHLRSLHCLSDAEERLKLCEQVFLRTYGANMERLENIKGTSGNESVLLVRLRLLQGILCYLVNRQKEAVEKFNEVENHIQVLKVDNENVKTLCNLGYSAKEARIALRATLNDLNAAVDYILNQREKKLRVRQHEKIKKFADKHTCLNGDLINLTVLEQLHNMGYTRLIGVHALLNSNNRINDALIWIENFLSSLYLQYPSNAVDEMKALEFDDPDVRPILKLYNYELNDACVHELLAFLLKSDSNSASVGLSSDLPYNLSQETPSTSNSNNAQSAESRRKKEILQIKEQEALIRLQDSISNDADDYLDIDLQSEEKFLRHYKSLLPQ